MSITLSANGKPRSVAAGSTVADLLAGAQLEPGLVFVEYNGEPLERELFASTPLRDGDRVEIAQMVGGG
jgi:sulfur carrier protein